VSISLVTAAPPVPLSATATSTAVLANNAAFQLSLVPSGATTAPLAADYNTLSTSTTATPPVPLPATATSTAVLANNAAFQLSLVETGATTAPVATPDYNTLPTAQTPVAGTADAFAFVPTDTAIDPPWSTSADGTTFATYLDTTGIGVLSSPAPTPFGSTLPGLALGALASAAQAQANPFAQLGVGINVSALG
jgi:hypothetical protein